MKIGGVRRFLCHSFTTSFVRVDQTVGEFVPTVVYHDLTFSIHYMVNFATIQYDE